MKTLPKTGLVIVAAGSGKRFGGPKQFALLGGEPLLSHCLRAFDEVDWVARRVVSLSSEILGDERWGRIADSLRCPVEGIRGGSTRAESTLRGTEALAGECDLVVVHDAARPFPPVEATRRCADLLQERPELSCALIASRVADTLKALKGDGVEIARSVDRSLTVRAETPQVCRTDHLIQALSRDGALEATDEGQALEWAGCRTAVVLHGGFNIKVTTPSDLHAAESYLAKSKGDG